MKYFNYAMRPFYYCALCAIAVNLLLIVCGIAQKDKKGSINNQ